MLVAMMVAGLLAQAPVDEAGVCRAAPAETLVGERYRRHLPTRIKRLTGARVLRTMMPGTMATMDYRADRVNVRVDHLRRVTAITCG